VITVDGSMLRAVRPVTFRTGRRRTSCRRGDVPGLESFVLPGVRCLGRRECLTRSITTSVIGAVSYLCGGACSGRQRLGRRWAAEVAKQG